MDSVGINEAGLVVSTFNFEWTIKLRAWYINFKM
jgi:hypothetical protein